MERRSGAIHQTARLREGSRSAFAHVVADHLGVATPLDQDALHRVLPVVRGLSRRWTRMLSIACSLSFAASLVEPSDSCTTWCRTVGEAPPLAELFGQDPR